MRAKVNQLAADVRVINASRIGRTFRLDPVRVLEERDPLRRLIRLAAHQVVQTDAEHASNRASPRA